MKKWWKYFKTEFLSRVCSSKKRIIKFIVICLVPFLYGFICIWAFWNPIGNLGNSPMAIVNQSKPVTLVIDSNSDQTLKMENSSPTTRSDEDESDIPEKVNAAKVGGVHFNIAIATYYVGLKKIGDTYKWDGEPVSVKDLINDKDIIKFTEYAKNYSAVAIYTHNQTYQLDAKNEKLTSQNKNEIFGKPIFWTNDNQKDIKIIPNFSIVRDYFTWWKKHPSDQNVIQYDENKNRYSIMLQSEREWNEEKQSYELISKQKLSNVEYLDGEAANDMAELVPDKDEPDKPNHWKVNDDKYWLQVQIPPNFNASAISLLNGYLIGTNQSIENASYFSDQLKKNPVNIWTTFKQNFLFGQFMKISTEFKAAILLNMVPNLVSQTIATGITNALNDNKNDQSELYFKAPNGGDLIINGNIHKLEKDNEYAIYNKETLNDVKKYSENTTNFPTLNNLTQTLIGPEENGKANTFTSYLAKSYQDITKNGFYKDVVNVILNTIVIGGSCEKPYWLSNIQLRQVFGTDKGIQSIFELDVDLFKSLSNADVVIPGTDYKISWNEFSDIFINALKRNVGLIPLFNKEQLVVSKNELNNNLGKNISSWMGFLSSGATKFENFNGIITNNIQGQEYAIYGIGLGEFFLCIGIWVGILMQTFVFDRHVRRSKKDEWKIGKHGKLDTKGDKWARYHDASAWWFAKNSLMSLTTIIQVTFLMVTVGLLGWFQIGPSFGWLYMSVLFTGLVWTTFIQSLWFLARDEVIGKFIVILFLIINITSGWGTFPPVMQFKFFQVISNVAPFTYCIHNQGIIIYGIAVNGSNNLDVIAILKNCGIQIIYLTIGYLLSIYEGMNLQKLTFFGSSSAKKVGKSIELLNLTYSSNLLIKTKNKKDKEIVKVNWDELDWTYNKAIANLTNSLYPPIPNFKSYTEKHDCHTYSISE